jgi:hypothetical protein
LEPAADLSDTRYHPAPSVPLPVIFWPPALVYTSLQAEELCDPAAEIVPGGHGWHWYIVWAPAPDGASAISPNSAPSLQALFL